MEKESVIATKLFFKMKMLSMKAMKMKFYLSALVLLLTACKAGTLDEAVDPNATYNPSQIELLAQCRNADFTQCGFRSGINQNFRIYVYNNSCNFLDDSTRVASKFASLTCNNVGCTTTNFTPWINATNGSTLSSLNAGTYCARALYDLDGTGTQSKDDILCTNQFVIRSASTQITLDFSLKGLCTVVP